MAITFSSTVDADFAAVNPSLTVNTAGTTTFSDDVRAIRRFGSLSTDAAGSTVLGGAAATVEVDTHGGGQSYGDAVELAANATLNSLANGAITFNSTVDAAACRLAIPAWQSTRPA